MTTVSLAKLVRGAACSRTGSPRDSDPVLPLVGHARFVLPGEANSRGILAKIRQGILVQWGKVDR